LAPSVVDEQSEKGYVRRLVEYSLLGEQVRAFLFLPRQNLANGRLPAVVAIHQDGNRPTTDIGKSEPAGLAGDSDQHYGLELARRGYVVVCADRPGFEGRQPVTRPEPAVVWEIFELSCAVDFLL